MTLRVGLLFATLVILCAQQVPPAAPPDDDVTAYLRERRGPALRRAAADDLVRAGYVALGLKAYAEAEDDFRKAMDLTPFSDSGMVYFSDGGIRGVARVYLAQNRKDDAFRFLQAEIAKTQYDVGAVNVLVDIALETGDSNIALEALAKTTQYTPTFLQEAKIYRLQGDLESAIGAMRKAQAMSPGDTTVNIALARDLIAAGHTEDGSHIFQTLLKVDITDATAVQGRCAELASGDNSDRILSLVCAQYAAALKPDDPDVMEALAWAYVSQFVPSQSIPVYETLVELAPQNYLYHFHFAMALAQQGYSTKDHQLAELKSALACNPPDGVKANIQIMIDQLAKLPANAPRKQE